MEEETALWDIIGATRKHARQVLIRKGSGKGARVRQASPRRRLLSKAELVTDVFARCLDGEDAPRREAVLQSRWNAARDYLGVFRTSANDRWILLAASRKIKVRCEEIKIRVEAKVRLLGLMLRLSSDEALCAKLGLARVPPVHSLVNAMTALDLRSKVLKFFDVSADLVSELGSSDVAEA